ncbi:hypothetical protein OG21DRAFT_1524057 [Imleria badia]|nr:hypothetical protein OG21DRAFT_1524057 [Imleria badia]
MAGIPRLMVSVPLQIIPISNQISSFLGKIGFNILDNQPSAYQTLLVSILLLECATVLFATTNATLGIALQEAYDSISLHSFKSINLQYLSLFFRQNGFEISHFL